jgi:hypothetical protein
MAEAWRLNSLSRRATAAAAGAGLALVLVASAVRSARLTSLREFAGASRIVARLAHDTAPDAGGDGAVGAPPPGEGSIVLFPSPLNGSRAGRLASALWLLEQRDTAVLSTPGMSGDAVKSLLDQWRAAGRSVYFVADELGPLPEVAGYDPEPVAEEAWVTTMLAADPKLPPRVDTLDVEMKVYRLVPVGSPDRG